MTLNRVKLTRFKTDIDDALELGKSEDEALNIAINIAKIKGYDDEAIKQAVEYCASPPPPADIPNELALRNILQFEIPALFRRQHLNRDVIGIPIGDRGSGKSILTVVTGICDYALQGDSIFSNMDIKATFVVDGPTAWKYGLKPGTVTYESQLIDKDEFLDGNDKYMNGAALIEEINVWLADARRSMSNDNLAASDLVQMIRKYHTALWGNCIEEMFVDYRIRDAADMFIMCEDSALFPEGLEAKKLQGYDFALKIFPMSRKLTGMKFSEGQPPIEAFLHGRQFWNSYDTDKRQKRSKYKAHKEGSTVEPEIEVGEAPEVAAYHAKYGWLEDRVRAIARERDKARYPVENGLTTATGKELWGLLGVGPESYNSRNFIRALEAVGVRKLKAEKGVTTYGIPSYKGMITNAE